MTALPGNRWDLLDGVEPETPPFTTVVIAHYDQQAELDRCLAAVRRQTHPADALEVIVVDDGSPVAPRIPPGVRLVVQEDRGFRLAAARNAGAALARGEVLCFLDADTVPEPDYVRRITRLPSLAPDVVAVGRRRHADLADLPASAPVEVAAPPRESPEPPWLVEAYAASRDLLDADDRSFRHLIGAVLACSSALFHETGGFDESFTEYGGEDWEWAYRAWLAGALFAHVRDAVAWHDGPDWSARPADHLAIKNREAMRLSGLIPLPRTGSRGIPGGAADVRIGLPPDYDAADPRWFVALDSVRAALPLAAMPDDPRGGRNCRIRFDLRRPLRAPASTIQDLVDRVGREGLASLTVLDPAGESLCVVRSVRAEARAARWGRDDLFPTVSGSVRGVEPVAGDVDVEGYLGGWA